MLALIKANYLGDFSEIVKYIRSGELEVNSVLVIVVMHIARQKDNVEIVGLLQLSREDADRFLFDRLRMSGWKGGRAL
jgi:hypothetical protein